MKKLFAILLCIALIIVPMSVSVSAEGALNAEEMKIMEVLKGTLVLDDGTEIKIPENYITQAENYFKTIDVTAEQATEILGYIEEGKKVVADSDLKVKHTADLKVLAQAEKQKILDLGKKACAVTNATLTYDGKDVTIVSDVTGATLFDAAPVVKATGAEADFTVVAIVLSSVVVLLGAAFVVSKKIGLIK